MESMHKKEIISSLMNYINSDSNLSILVNGKWGSGKTHLILNDLKNEVQNSEKNYIYISLYGLKEIHQINKNIMQKIIFFYSSEKIKDIKSKDSYLKSKIENDEILNNIISLLKYIFDKIKNFFVYTKEFWNNPLTILIKQISVNGLTKKYGVDLINLNCNQIEYFSGFVIVFDDLERCTIGIEEILGYINTFVEHNKNKVIIVANQEEIKGEKYKEIKEKTIEKTLEYKPSIEEILSVFEDKSKYKFIDKHMKELENAIEKLDKKNIRTIKFAVDSYKIIYDFLEYEKLDAEYKEKLLDDIFKYCLKSSIEFKQNLSKYDWGSGNISIYKDYLNYDSYLIRFKFVDDLIKYSIFNKEDILKTLEQYIIDEKQIKDNREDPINVLMNFWEMDEYDVKNSLDKLYENIQSNKYNFEEYEKIIYILIRIKEYDFDIKNSIEIMKAFFEKDINIQSIDNGKILYDGNFEFKKTINEFTEIGKNKEKNKLKKIFSEYYESDDFGSLFAEYIIENKSYFMSKKLLFSLIDIEKLKLNIKNANTKNISDFKRALYSFYEFAEINLINNDRDNIKELVSWLKEYEVVDNKIKKKNIDELINLLESQLKKI